MTSEETHQAVKQLKQFAKRWNELYAAQKFEEMKDLATEDIGIANAPESKDSSGLIYGRQAYFNGIYDAYRGSTGKEQNLLVMDYENWEYIALATIAFIPLGNILSSQTWWE